VTRGRCRAASNGWPSLGAAAPSRGHFNCPVRMPERNGPTSAMTLEQLLACALAPAQGWRPGLWPPESWPPESWPPEVRALTGTRRPVWSEIDRLPLRAHGTVPAATSAWRATSEILTKVLPKCLNDRNASIRLDARRGWRPAQRMVSIFSGTAAPARQGDRAGTRRAVTVPEGTPVAVVRPSPAGQTAGSKRFAGACHGEFSKRFDYPREELLAGRTARGKPEQLDAHPV